MFINAQIYVNVDILCMYVTIKKGEGTNTSAIFAVAHAMGDHCCYMSLCFIYQYTCAYILFCVYLYAL